MNVNQCRLCCKNDDFAVNVFENIEEKLCQKIFACFGVQIKKNDPITKKICKCCYYFTNSVYEHRIVSQKNNIKLKAEYEKLSAIKPEISQNDFLNTLKLDSIKIHKSVSALKRKYPTINIPECCNGLDLDPVVKILNKKKRKDESWSISSKTSSGLVFTMVKHDEADAENKAKKAKKFSCETCHKVFVQEKMFLSHKCNIQEYFKCTNCNRGFRYMETLKQHRASYHKLPTELNKIADVSETADLKTLLDINVKINESNYINKLKLAKEQESKKNIETKEKKAEVKKKDKEEVIPPENKDKEEVITENKDIEEVIIENKDKEVEDKKENSENKEREEITLQSLLESPKTARNDLLVQDAEVNTFLCLTCNKIFDTQETLTYHKRYAHKSSLRCDQCPKKFQVVETLMKHQETHKILKRKQEARARALEKQKENENAKDDDPKEDEKIDKNEDKKEEESLEEVREESLNSEKVFVQEFKESVSPKIAKRASSLPQLSVSLEPLFGYPNTNKNSPPGKMVARKRTNGVSVVTNSQETYRISSDSDSTLSSSDEDDCKITEVFTDPLKEAKDETEPEICLDLALEPQNDDMDLVELEMGPQNETIEMDETELEVVVSTTTVATTTTTTDTTVATTTTTTTDTTVATTTIATTNSSTATTSEVVNEEVFVIDDSDSEIEENPVELEPKVPEKSEPEVPDKPTSDSPILISATNDELTTANERNYINYLINKSTCDDKNAHIPKSWTLHYLKSLAKKTTIPVEVKKSNDPKIKLSYTKTCPKTKAQIPLTPWNHAKAIDLNVGLNNKSQKKNNQSMVKNQKAYVPQTVKTKLINGPNMNQFTTKYIPVATPQKKQFTTPTSTPPNQNKRMPVTTPTSTTHQKEIPPQAPQFYANQEQRKSVTTPTSTTHQKEIPPQAPQFYLANQSVTTPTSATHHKEILSKAPQFYLANQTNQEQRIPVTTPTSTTHHKEILPKAPQFYVTANQEQRKPPTSTTHKEILPKAPQFYLEANQEQRTPIHKEILPKAPQFYLQANQEQRIPVTTPTSTPIQKEILPKAPQFYVTNQSQQDQRIPSSAPKIHKEIPAAGPQFYTQEQRRSILKNTLQHPPMVYTYVPPSQVFNQQQQKQLDQSSFMITNMNKNATIVFQQIDQPNFINISQPENTQIFMQPNMIQQQQQQQAEQEPLAPPETETSEDDPEHRPLIRIKNLSELTAKSPESYFNAYANYVKAMPSVT